MKTILVLALLAAIAAGCGGASNSTVVPTAITGNPTATAVPLETATVIHPTVAPSIQEPSPVATAPNRTATLLGAAPSIPPTIALAKLHVAAIALPGGAAGIGFDDLMFDAGLGRVIAPAGRTGNLDLIDPATLAVTAINGFAAASQFDGGHDFGTTSADAGGGLLFAIDRNASKVLVVDPARKVIVASAALGGTPDYLRYATLTRELWVTEPDTERIEVFAVPQGSSPVPAHVTFITVRGGPESMVIDGTRQAAYTHLWNGGTVAVDLRSRAIRATWPNGCAASRGIALDEPRGLLFAGCAEGKAVVLDVAHNGSQLASLSFGSGVDVISYNPALAHLYLPGTTSATMGIIGVGAQGALVLLGTADIPSGAHCVVADNHGQAWVCDPAHGQLLLVKDTLLGAGR
jgi:hypothetical protein